MPVKCGFISTTLLAGTLCACGGGSSDGDAIGDAGGGITRVTVDRLTAAADEEGNWLRHGRTYSEQRFSPCDGYPVALDAANGDERWRTDTINGKLPYTITGSPRVVNGLVPISLRSGR